MTFIHRDADMEAEGFEPHTHETVAEARDCEQSFLAYLMEPKCCPVCDAIGCGANGGGCRQFEWGTELMQAEAQAELAEYDLWLEMSR